MLNFLKFCFIFIVSLTVQNALFGQKQFESSVYERIDSFYEVEEYDLLTEYLIQIANLDTNSLTSTFRVDVKSELGYLYAIEEKFETSQEYFIKASKIILNQNPLDTSRLGEIYYYLAYVANESDDQEKALDFLQESIQFLQKESDKKQLANCLNGIANIYLKKSDYDNALFYQTEAKSIFKRLDSVDLELARVYDDLSLIYYYKLDYTNALEFSIKGIDLLEKVKEDNFYFKSSFHINRALIYIKLEELDLGLQYLDLAHHYIEMSNDDRLSAKLLFNYGFCFLEKRAFEKAEKYFKESIELMKEDEKSNRLLLSKAYFYLASLNASFENDLLALSKIDTSLYFLIPTYDLNLPNQNPQLNSFSLSDRNLVKSLILKIDLLGQLLLVDPTNKEQEELLFETISFAFKRVRDLRTDLVLEESKLFIAEELKELFDNVIEIAFQLYSKTSNKKYLELAFNCFESSRAPLLMINENKKANYRLGGVPQKLLDLENKLAIDFNYYRRMTALSEKSVKDQTLFRNEKYLQKAKHKLDSIHSIFQTNYPKYYKDIYLQKTVLLNRFQDVLSSDDNFIMFYDADDNIYRFHITKNFIHFTCLNNEKQLESDLDDLYEIFSSAPKSNEEYYKDFQDYKVIANRIKEVVVPDLELNSSLHIVTSGRMNSLAFGALPINLITDEMIDFLDVSYLIEKYPISYQKSASNFTFSLGNQLKQKHSGVLGFCPFNIKSKNEMLHLPFSESELSGIESKIKGSFYYSEEANKNIFLKEHTSHQILHFASHATVDYSNPNFSHLNLFGIDDKADTCSIYAYEIQNINFTSDLAVLSACESGNGKNNSGEGYLSLANAFMYGGVPSILMSRWKINDLSSSELMVNYYDYLVKGEKKDLAIQLSKKNFLSTKADQYTAHPYYWGSFAQVGNIQPITKSFWNNVILYVLLGLMILLLILYKVTRSV